MSKLGAMTKIKSCKIDRILWEMRAICLVSCFPFVSVCTRTYCARAHSLYRNPAKQTSYICRALGSGGAGGAAAPPGKFHKPKKAEIFAKRQ